MLRLRRKRLRTTGSDKMHATGGGAGCTSDWAKAPSAHCAILRASAAIAFCGQRTSQQGWEPNWMSNGYGPMHYYMQYSTYHGYAYIYVRTCLISM